MTAHLNTSLWFFWGELTPARVAASAAFWLVVLIGFGAAGATAVAGLWRVCG